MKYLQYLSIAIFICATSLSAKPLEGIVILHSKILYRGKLTFNTNLSFKDLIRGKRVRFDWRDVARIDVLKSEMRANTLRKSGEEEIHQKYIVAVTNWQGERYWGQKSFRVTVSKKFKKSKKYKKFRFLVPQTSRVKKYPQFVRKILFKHEKNKKFPTAQIPSLAGKINLPTKNFFDKVYAVHIQAGIIFEGKIDKDSYQLTNLIPGSYDLIFVGPKAIAFALSTPLRRSILDRDIHGSSSNFGGWVKKSTADEKMAREAKFYLGRYSSTRAIISQQVNKDYSLWLWVCSYHNQSWTMRNRQILYKAQQTRLPQLLTDDKLAGVFVGFGAKNFDYVIK